MTGVVIGQGIIPGAWRAGSIPWKRGKGEPRVRSAGAGRNQRGPAPAPRRKGPGALCPLHVDSAWTLRDHTATWTKLSETCCDGQRSLMRAAVNFLRRVATAPCLGAALHGPRCSIFSSAGLREATTQLTNTVPPQKSHLTRRRRTATRKTGLLWRARTRTALSLGDNAGRSVQMRQSQCS